MPINLISKNDLEQWLQTFDTLLVDCDGVLWSGKIPVEGAMHAIQILKEKYSKKVIFITNNSAHSRQSYSEKFCKLGYKGVTAHEVMCTSYCASYYLSSILKLQEKNLSALVIGEQGLIDEITMSGISVVKPNLVHDGLDPSHGQFNLDAFSHLADEKNTASLLQRDPTIGAVVFGLCTSINYISFAQAYAQLCPPSNAVFVLTNDDMTLPIGKTKFPGTGSLASVLSSALGKQPDVILGKPHSIMLECLQNLLKLDRCDPSRICIIGDNLATDIAFGKNASYSTVLTFSGVTDEKYFARMIDETRSNASEEFIQATLPDYTMSSLKIIVDYFDSQDL